MMEEVDVVDERDEVVDRATLEEAHEEGLLHRSVHVLIFTNDGRLMSQLRSEDKEIRPLHWTSSAAGHVEAGEKPLQAAQREVEEELGIDTDLIYVGKFLNHDKVDDEIVYVFYGEHPGPYTISDEAEEIAGYDLDFLIENPDDLDIDPNFEKAIAFFSEKEVSDR